MEDCRLVFSNIFAGFQKAALLLGFVVIGLFSAVSVQAQDTKSELKANLSELSTLYQNEVQRLEKQQQQSKDLYNDGLISRVEFDKGEKALAHPRAKVEQVAKEIATANQPPTLIAEDIVASAVEAVWSTGDSKIDSLIRY